MTKEFTSEIIKFSIETNASFNQLLISAEEACDENEFKQMKKEVGQVRYIY